MKKLFEIIKQEKIEDREIYCNLQYSSENYERLMKSLSEEEKSCSIYPEEFNEELERWGIKRTPITQDISNNINSIIKSYGKKNTCSHKY